MSVQVTELPTPTEEAMYTLYAIRHADEIILDTETGRITVTKSGKEYRVPDDPFDDLMLRGWVVSHDDIGGVEVTTDGVYWLNRWKKNQKKRAKKPAHPRPGIHRQWRG